MDAAIIAVGCAGGRMVNHMVGRIKAKYLAINTDRRELDACRVGRKILIGEPRSQGRAGANDASAVCRKYTAFGRTSSWTKSLETNRRSGSFSRPWRGRRSRACLESRQ